MSTACTPAVLFMMIGPTEAQEAKTGDRRKEMSDITEVFKVEISGVLVLSYGMDDTAPDPNSWDLPILLDELTMTMHASPTATLTLVHSSYPVVDVPPVLPRDEDRPGYCEGCVRIEMSKMDYGKVFPAFRAVGSDECEAHNENLLDERQLEESE